MRMVKKMSKKTKELLVSAFLDFINDEEFDKITVTDLVDKCSISRQTFYYHFEDIHNMLVWAFGQEISLICDSQDPDDWEKTEKKFIEFFKKYDMLLRKSIKSTDFLFIINLIDKSFYDFITSYISIKRRNEANFGKNADYVISYTAGAYTSLVLKTIQCEKSNYETIINNLSTSLKGI